MPIALECHGCGKKLWVKDEAAGGKVRCPACNYIMDIPDVEELDELEEVEEQKGRQRRRRRRRRRPRKQPQNTGRYFDAMERPDDPLLIGMFDGVFCFHVILLIVGAVALMPLAVFVVVFGNDREAGRNAGLVLVVGTIQLMLIGFAYMLLKSWDTLY